MHLFGWGEQPINRYKAYEYFCRAHRAGCAAATHNRMVSQGMGYGCKKQSVPVAAEHLSAMAENPTTSNAVKLVILVGVNLFLTCGFLMTIPCPRPIWV